MNLTYRATAVVLLSAVVALANAPTDSSTVCDRYQKNDLVFTGTAESAWITMVDTRKSPIHKRSEKSKRVRFLVREWFKGERRNSVEIWITPGDCPLKIEADHTYLIYARRNADNERIETNGCMGTIPVESAAADIQYLTAIQVGPAQANRIYGVASGPGLNVLAKSDKEIRYAISDANGKFVFDGLHAGNWGVSVLDGTPKQVRLEPASCLEVDLK